MGVRSMREEMGQRIEVLIKWKGVPEFDATWEDFQTVNGTFPDFDLEDKVLLWGQSNVVHPPLQFTYKRRKQKKMLKGQGTTTNHNDPAEVEEGQGYIGN